ncbi:MAG: hypothetical protein PUE28_02400 [Lactobacillus porci]|nr:hypothetical protein [Lactobacillus porci]
MKKMQERLSHMYPPKIYWAIVVCLVASLPVILLLSHLGYASVANWIVIIAGMFLADILLMTFTKHGMNFVAASVLALAITIIIAAVLIFYIMSSNNL